MDVWPLPRISFRALTSVDEKRPAALIAQPSVWATVSQSLNLPLLIQAEPTKDDYDFIEYLATNLPDPVQVIYAVGEGLVIDIAKVVASVNDKPLVIVPSAISSDAPFSPTATVRDQGRPSLEPTGPAEEVIIDMDLIQKAPAELRGAGIVDVLSIVTGILDWKHATQKQKTNNETKMVAWAVGLAAGLGAQALKSAAAIGKGDPESLRTLVDLLCMIVQLDNQLGHDRVSHGIEHIFADAVKADSSVSHAEKVGPGILIASALYNQEPAPMRTAMEAAGIRLDRLTADDIRTAVMGLPEYVKSNETPYSILNDLATNAPELETALNKSTLIR